MSSTTMNCTALSNASAHHFLLFEAIMCRFLSWSWARGRGSPPPRPRRDRVAPDPRCGYPHRAVWRRERRSVDSRLASLQDELAKRKSDLVIRKDDVYTVRVSRRYDQYCPIAHALDLIGERWSLLVIRELLHGPLRYTDIAARLHGCSTNMLAARLRALEEGGVVERYRLPPPAASQVSR